MDVRKISLYLSGKTPPYEKYSRFEFFEHLEGIFDYKLDKLDFYWKQAREFEEEFYYLVFDKIYSKSKKDDGDKDKLNLLLERLELPLSVYNDNIVNSLKNIKPLIITEGKTDVKILKTAWNKLYPNEECPFEIIESGLDNKSGSANVLKNQLNYATTYGVERTIIGLFDNDKEGNEQFKGLDKDIFEEYSIDKDIRKHNNSSIYGLLLQIPDFREKFISKTSINKRYFEIEHYFSDKLLKQHNILKEDDTLSNGIFEIGNSKNSFSESVNKFNKEEFKNFELMFNRIKKYI